MSKCESGLKSFRCSCQIADHISDECSTAKHCRERRALEGQMSALQTARAALEENVGN